MHIRFTPVRLALAAALAFGSQAQAQNAPIKVGLMLPATGTFASLGTMIENGFKLYVAEQGGKLGGNEVQYFKVDDESDPANAPFLALLQERFGERAGRSFSEDEWRDWLREIARKLREGIREFSVKSLGETARRPDLTEGEVFARLSDIIDGQFALAQRLGAP